MSEEHTKTTVEIISAYVSNNHLRAEELVELIKDVHGKLVELANGKAEPQAEAKPEPRLPIKKTITPGYLISLEDGKPYKTLRRHLTIRGMTPEDYRAKWGLPADYPMVAKEYAERRSALAKSMGLGSKRVKAEQGEAAAAIAEDLVDIIAEDVIEQQAVEETLVEEKSSPKKAGRKVSPHPKPKDRAKAKNAPKQAEGNYPRGGRRSAAAQLCAGCDGVLARRDEG